MAKVIVATMSEWHQVQRKYALEIDVAYLKDLFPNESDEDIQKMFDDLVKLYNKKFTFILNANNYGVGGSLKILFNYLLDKNFTYLINLQSSDHYEINQVLNNFLKTKPSETNLDYYLHSRFLKPEDTKKYSFLRKIANLVFIKLTKILTKCNFSDPGMSVFMIKKNLCNIMTKEEFKSMSSSSHYPHLMNIILHKHVKTYKELDIRWRNGNTKSHLNCFSYPILLLVNLISYKINGYFIKYSNKNNFKFQILTNKLLSK